MFFSEVIRKLGMVSVKQSQNEAEKPMDAIPGTNPGTIGQFVQFVHPISPLESSMRP
jgi:hypothetical protein